MSIRKRSDRDHATHLQGTLDLLILRTLIFGPEHGQGIARAIQRESEDVLIVDHGSLYPALQRLEERGFIDAEWGTSETNRKARFYTLTKKGRKDQARAADAALHVAEEIDERTGRRDDERGPIDLRQRRAVVGEDRRGAERER